MAYGFGGTGGNFSFSPYEDTLSQQRYGTMLGQDPTAAAFALMQDQGYRPESSFGSFIGGLAPLLEVLRTTQEAKTGLAGVQPGINTFGGLMNDLLNPRQAGVGGPDLVKRGLGQIRDIGAGNAGASSYLEDPGGVGGDVRALVSTQLGGRSANRLFSNDFLSRLLAGFTQGQQNSGTGAQSGPGSQNIVKYLQQAGVL
jgi:hypothetical protein